MRSGEVPNQICARAIALGDGDGDGNGAGDRVRAVEELIRLADGRRPPLDQARNALVSRIRLHPDDYQATSGLIALNAALAEVGWAAAITWEPRRQRRPRRRTPGRIQAA